ncbi:methionyl-tRNA formyltransferase [Bacteroidia bacterium]|nr:methionyl-tRNA formyltransferase [Bacteroidia bacterium]
MKKVVFYCMTYKGYWVLKKFIERFTSDAIEAVIIARDKNVENDYFDEISQLCNENNISYFERHQTDKIEQIKANCLFAISWRWLIKSDKKIIVLHDSLLPKYRGFAPLVNCLIHNEAQIGVTALFASENYDCGDIIAQKSLKITYPITISEAIERITPLYSELVNLVAGHYFSDQEIKGSKQNDEDATYSLWRDDEDYFIHWGDSAENIKRFIDAVGYPYAGARTLLDNREMKIKNATVVQDLQIENRDVGKVIFFNAGCPVVVCKVGLLQLDVVVDALGNLVHFNKFRIRFK